MGRLPCPHPDPQLGKQVSQQMVGSSCGREGPPVLLAGRLVSDKKGLFAFLLRQVSKVCSPGRPQTFGNLLPPTPLILGSNAYAITLGTESLLTPIGSILALHTPGHKHNGSLVALSLLREPSTEGWDSVVGAGRKAALGGCLASSPQPA